MIAARRCLLHATLIVVGGLFLLPLAWMVLTAMRADPGAAPTPGALAANVAAVLSDDVVTFPVYLRNSLLVGMLGVGGTVVSSIVVAYGLARIRWRGRTLAFGLILGTMIIPFPAIMVPLYLVFQDLGWLGTFRPLWVPAWFGHAFSIFLLRQFMLTIPGELDEAARLDGCGHGGIFRHIVLPLTRPALVVVALLQFLFLWNDFLGPLIFLTDRDQFTLALGLHLYQSQQGSTPWPLLMAASTLFVAPVLLLFLLGQREIVQGIAVRGLKG